MDNFSPKHRDEVIYLGWNIRRDSQRMQNGETIIGVIFSITSITDKTSSTMLYGSSEIVDTIVRQKIIGGKPGHTYKLRATVTTSLGQTIVLEDTFKVK